uniref:Macaca fascicularis brain cDNA clone: QflA-22424, similar to human zinc fingers and homeoboxes 3 (ZHX3), mRNA, RefSeq: NM_015035.2 n=1 Tax=Macaca fascicularis TaxID=9541 RepID=I7G7C0_MACFA|nr:unnamed protein product [Macaca fascicularis]
MSSLKMTCVCSLGIAGSQMPLTFHSQAGKL